MQKTQGVVAEKGKVSKFMKIENSMDFVTLMEIMTWWKTIYWKG
jgi:hypothetical protein